MADCGADKRLPCSDKKESSSPLPAAPDPRIHSVRPCLHAKTMRRTSVTNQSLSSPHLRPRCRSNSCLLVAIRLKLCRRVCEPRPAVPHEVFRHWRQPGNDARKRITSKLPVEDVARQYLKGRDDPAIAACISNKLRSRGELMTAAAVGAPASDS
jgi:hypothetical protein